LSGSEIARIIVRNHVNRVLPRRRIGMVLDFAYLGLAAVRNIFDRPVSKYPMKVRNPKPRIGLSEDSERVRLWWHLSILN